MVAAVPQPAGADDVWERVELVGGRWNGGDPRCSCHQE